eukprot:SAG31_NODE_29744_length_390_cov_1.178694_1_plen_52_part_10
MVKVLLEGGADMTATDSASRCDACARCLGLRLLLARAHVSVVKSSIYVTDRV